MNSAAIGLLGRQYFAVLRRCFFLNAVAMAAWLPMAVSPVSASSIRPDGRTATVLEQSGSRTDISTSTVRGGTAFNSFSEFSVGRGQTVNLHLP